MEQLLDGQPKRRNELAKQLVKTGVIERATLTKALATLREKDYVERSERPDEKNPKRIAVYYAIHPECIHLIEYELNLEPDFDWPDDLRPILDQVANSNRSLSDRCERLDTLFNLYQDYELHYIQHQLMFAAYCRLRGDKELFRQLANAARRNFEKYAGHLLSAIEKDPIVAFAYVKWSTEKINEHDQQRDPKIPSGDFYWDDMLNDELERKQIITDSELGNRISEWLPHLDYEKIATDFSKPLEHDEEIHKVDERNLRKDFAVLTQRATYLSKARSEKQ